MEYAFPDWRRRILSLSGEFGYWEESRGLIDLCGASAIVRCRTAGATGSLRCAGEPSHSRYRADRAGLNLHEAFRESDGEDVVARMIDRYRDPVLPNLLPDDRGGAEEWCGWRTTLSLRRSGQKGGFRGRSDPD